jgi:hypothetical protein
MMKFQSCNKIQFVLVLLILTIMTAVSADNAEPKTIDLEKDWGVQPVMLRVSAGGYMIEFRYKILDTEKAQIFTSKSEKDFPFLLSMKSRVRLGVPFGTTVGYLKSNRKFLKQGKNYITMFSNINRHMLPGDQVKIQISDQVSEVLTIEK